MTKKRTDRLKFFINRKNAEMRRVDARWTKKIDDEVQRLKKKGVL